MDDAEYTVKLTCIDCDNAECNICPNGTMLGEDDKRGCCRVVDEQLYVEYFHQVEEEMPFLFSCDTVEQVRSICNETLDVLYKIYDCPVAYRINRTGKALKK